MKAQSKEFITVTKKTPCVACGHGDWCGYNDKVAICMRVQSDRPSKNGGWIHRLNESINVFQREIKPLPKKQTVAPDFVKMICEWRNEIDWSAIEAHALSLGVSAVALDALSICWCASKKAWAFPMLDANENIIGVRLRNESGKKWAVSGSRQGLFYDRLISPPNRTAYICEGPTDTAAMITLGFWAVGRAACLGQADQLRDLFKRLNVNKIVVVCDNDEAKKLPDGNEFYPGKEGAQKLINELKMQCKMIMPPVKDIRKWVQAGATRDMVLYLENQQAWRFF